MPPLRMWKKLFGPIHFERAMANGGKANTGLTVQWCNFSDGQRFRVIDLVRGQSSQKWKSVFMSRFWNIPPPAHRVGDTLLVLVFNGIYWQLERYITTPFTLSSANFGLGTHILHHLNFPRCGFSRQVLLLPWIKALTQYKNLFWELCLKIWGLSSIKSSVHISSAFWMGREYTAVTTESITAYL